MCPSFSSSEGLSSEWRVTLMDHVKKLSLKRSLVKADLWDERLGDPLTEERATAALLQQMEQQLGHGAYLIFPPPTGLHGIREVRVIWEGMTSVLARDEDFAVALCLAALELPNFLCRHPECAAKQEQ